MTPRLGIALIAFGLVVAADRADEPKKATSSVEGSTPRVTLGLAVEEMPNQGPHGGVIIRHLVQDGPAAKAGLKTGDIIVRVSGMQVDDYEDLVGAIAGQKPGDQMTVTALRDGEPTRVKVTLGEPAKEAKNAAHPEGCRSCAYLGVITTPVTQLADGTVQRLGLADDRGLVVIDVLPGSPAATAGLRHGDVIRSIDGAEVRDPDALRTQVKEAGTGKEVKLDVRRGDRQREVKATLAEGFCDVLLFTPKSGKGADKEVDQLRLRIEQLEKRLKELEGGKK